MDLLSNQGAFKTIKKVVDFTLDTIFPKFCVTCETEGSYLCQKCFSKILNAPFQSAFNIEKIIVAGSYKNRYLKEAIHFLKYRYIKELAYPLAGFVIGYLEQRFDKNFFGNQDTIIVPVPLHTKKLRQRGFNQIELIANIIGQHFNIEVKTPLQKIVNTPAQMTIEEREVRLSNLKNSFRCIEKDAVKNKAVFLIDDVITTGATLEECGKVLKQAGAREIWKIAIAGGE